MERTVERPQVEISLEGSDPSGRNAGGTSAAPEKKLVMVVAVSFGLLCVLQAGLNVSLRLSSFNQKPPTESSCQNEIRNLTDLLLHHGWVRFGSSIYYISTALKTWQESRADCQLRGADLLIINTKEEQNYFWKLSKRLWIGLDRINTETWKWVDGTPLDTSYWWRTEPNNLGGVEKCAEILAVKEENNWNDYQCQVPNHWVCERNVGP